MRGVGRALGDREWRAGKSSDDPHGSVLYAAKEDYDFENQAEMRYQEMKNYPARGSRPTSAR